MSVGVKCLRRSETYGSHAGSSSEACSHVGNDVVMFELGKAYSHAGNDAVMFKLVVML